MSSPPTVTLLHARATYTLEIPETLQELQREVEAATRVPVSGQRLVFSGRRLTGAGDTLLSTLGVCGGKKIMLLGRAGGLDERRELRCVNLERVDACRREVSEMEGRLRGVERRVGVGEDGLGLKRETMVLAEGFMKVLLTLDGIVEEGEQRGEVSGWKSERKALVRRVQANLERCDKLDKEVQ